MAKRYSDEDLATLASLGILVDKRNRLIFIDRILKNGYQLQPVDLKFFRYFSLRHVIALSFYVVGFSIWQINWLLSLAAALLVWLLAEIYLRFIFLKKKPLQSLKEEEIKAVSLVSLQKKQPDIKLKRKIMAYSLLGTVTLILAFFAGYELPYLVTMIGFTVYIWGYVTIMVMARWAKRADGEIQ